MSSLRGGSCRDAARLDGRTLPLKPAPRRTGTCGGGCGSTVVYVDVTVMIVFVAACVVAISTIIALVVVILHREDHASVPATVRAGGRAFGAALTLLVAALGVLLAAWREQ